MPEVVALYKYSYVYEGKTITFKKGEKFQLLDKPNGDWWHVRRWQDSGAEDIYVPANYVKEVQEEPAVSHSPLYENMFDVAASYKKTKEGIAPGEVKKDKCLPPPVRQKPTRASTGEKSKGDTEKASNGHIPRQGKKTTSAESKEQASSSGIPRIGSEGEASSPKRSQKLAGLPVVADKPRSKSINKANPVADEGISNLDRVPIESVLDRLPPGTTARLLNSTGPVGGGIVVGGGGGGGGGETKLPPPNVKPKPGRQQHQPPQQDGEQETVSPLPTSTSGGVTVFAPPAPSELKKPSKIHSYEEVMPLIKTPSPDTIIGGEPSPAPPKVRQR